MIKLVLLWLGNLRSSSYVFLVMLSEPNNCRNSNSSRRSNNKVVAARWVELVATETPDIEACPLNNLGRVDKQTVTESRAVAVDAGIIRFVVDDANRLSLQLYQIVLLLSSQNNSQSPVASGCVPSTSSWFFVRASNRSVPKSLLAFPHVHHSGVYVMSSYAW